MRRLDCVVQKYAWGKRGGSSKVAQLKQCESSDYEVSKSFEFVNFNRLMCSYTCCLRKVLWVFLRGLNETATML
jgi:Phosphomannose isomerase type I